MRKFYFLIGIAGLFLFFVFIGFSKILNSDDIPTSPSDLDLHMIIMPPSSPSPETSEENREKSEENREKKDISRVETEISEDSSSETLEENREKIVSETSIDSSTIFETPIVIIPEMKMIGEIMFSRGTPSGIAKHNDYLYMAMNVSDYPILIYDIKEPEKPKLVNFLDAPGWPVRPRIIDGKWLWSVFGNGEAIYDLKDPSKPRLLNPIEVIHPVMKLERINREEWKEEFHGKKFIVHPNFSYCTFVHKNTLYYGTWVDITKRDTSITEIYDIKDPKEPKLLSTIEGEVGNLVGNILFTSTKRGIFIYDVSEPSSPKKLTEIKVEDFEELVRKGIKLGGAGSATYNDGKVYIGIGQPLKNLWGKLKIDNPNLYQSGIAIIDVGDFSSKPKLLSWYIIEGEVSNIGNLVYHKGHIFANDKLFGLRVFDVSDPKNIKQVANDKQGGEFLTGALISNKKNKILCLGGSGGLIFVDVSNPRRPKILSNLSLYPYDIHEIAIYKDRYLYAFGTLSSSNLFLMNQTKLNLLFIIDLEDLKNPKLVNVVSDVTGFSKDVVKDAVIVDNYLYLCNGAIFDISQPENPKKLETFIPCKGIKIAYKKPYLYIADYQTLYILDIKEKKTPKIIGKLTKEENYLSSLGSKGIPFIGKYIILQADGKLHVVDISDIKNPTLVGSFDWAEFNVPEREEDKILFPNEISLWSDGKSLFIATYFSIIFTETRLIRNTFSNICMYEIEEILTEDNTLKLSLKKLKQVETQGGVKRIIGERYFGGIGTIYSIERSNVKIYRYSERR